MNALALRRSVALLVVAPVMALASRALHAQQPQPQQPSQPRADSTSPVRVTGTVYDSVSRSPLAAATVQLLNAADQTRVFTAQTDSSGHFALTVPPGRYVAGFFHPAVDALGIEAPLVAVDIPAAPSYEIQLSTPSPTRLTQAVCGIRPAPDSSGAMGGIVRDADTGDPLPGAKVVVSWLEITIGKGGVTQGQRRVPVTARADGTYTLCGLPDDTVIVSAELGARHSGLVAVAIPAHGMVRRDFSIGDSASAVAVAADTGVRATVLHGTSVLRGLVRRPDGKPLPNARVTLFGSGRTATTNGEGAFTLDSLPAGTFSVEARAIGFPPKYASVDLSRSHPATVAIRMDERATQLAAVTVIGKRSLRTEQMEDFLRRSRSGMGHYVTAAQLENRFAVTDALRMTPGLRVVPAGFGDAVYGRGGCTPAVYLDGMQLPGDGNQTIDQYVQPADVLGIEIYTGLGAAPPQYQSNGCGVILVWTKR